MAIKKIVKNNKRHAQKPRSCRVCRGGLSVDYKNILLLKKLISDRGKIMPKSKTGTCSKHQRQVTKAVKRARYIALLPFTDSHAL